MMFSQKLGRPSFLLMRCLRRLDEAETRATVVFRAFCAPCRGYDVAARKRGKKGKFRQARHHKLVAFRNCGVFWTRRALRF